MLVTVTVTVKLVIIIKIVSEKCVLKIVYLPVSHSSSTRPPSRISLTIGMIRTIGAALGDGLGLETPDRIQCSFFKSRPEQVSATQVQLPQSSLLRWPLLNMRRLEQATMFDDMRRPSVLSQWIFFTWTSFREQSFLDGKIKLGLVYIHNFFEH